MRVVRFLIEGEFEDAFLYMGCVVAIGRDQTVRIANLESLLDRSIGARAPSRPLARWLFERNDEMPSHRASIVEGLANGAIPQPQGPRKVHFAVDLESSEHQTFDLEV